MTPGDGNGWVRCRCGLRHWGLHGAAGLAVLRSLPGPGPDPAISLLLQLRADWTHQGGTWALPGGARDSHEDVVSAALREADEEVGADPRHLRVLATLPGLDHDDWRYTYVLALAPPTLRVERCNAETERLEWVPLDQVGHYPLHPALRLAWPELVNAIRAAAQAAARVDRRPE